MIFEEYYKLTGHDIEKDIKSEMSGDVEMAFLAITQIVKNPAAYFAERIYNSMKVR
jgi:annexin A7/11